MTQCEAVLAYIKKYGSITNKEAINELYIYCLSSRMSDLRKAGYPIHVDMKPVSTPYGKAQIAVYSLSEG